ncbi:MAG: serine hydrolase [Bdellovibrionaceae bacterium]|nr:serine hydrolase [Pseudobdellovibrionaceae bacterium]
MKSVFSLFPVVLIVVCGYLSSISQAATSVTLAEKELTSLIRNTKGAKTDVVLIYKDGKIIYQNYAREYGINTKHLSWSLGKTISGILIGIAESEGLLSFNDQVRKYFPKYHSNARILDLLGMSSGLKYKEEYDGFPSDLDITNMMYLKGPPQGFAHYMINLPPSPEGEAGSYFNYSSGDTNVLMAILQKAIGNQAVYNKYPWDKFFKPMGIDATFEQDLNGTFAGASYIYMKATDFLKVGQLIVNRGMWSGQQIIPNKYFDLMNRVADGVQQKVQKGNDKTKAYSAHVTTNLPIEGRGLPSTYNDLPLDALILYGHQGQIIVASPSQNVVILKLAMDKKALSSINFYAAVKKLILAKDLSYETVASIKGINSLDHEPETRGVISTILSIPHLLRAYGAKEYCSCRLVVGRSEAACKDDLKAQSLVIPKLKIKNDGTVTATLGLGLFKKSKAVYRGKSFGCVLTKTE